MLKFSSKWGFRSPHLLFYIVKSTGAVISISLYFSGRLLFSAIGFPPSFKILCHILLLSSIVFLTFQHLCNNAISRRAAEQNRALKAYCEGSGLKYRSDGVRAYGAITPNKITVPKPSQDNSQFNKPVVVDKTDQINAQHLVNGKPAEITLNRVTDRHNEIYLGVTLMIIGNLTVILPLKTMRRNICRIFAPSVRKSLTFYKKRL